MQPGVRNLCQLTEKWRVNSRVNISRLISLVHDAIGFTIIILKCLFTIGSFKLVFYLSISVLGSHKAKLEDIVADISSNAKLKFC